jgi:hypothetical protein
VSARESPSDPPPGALAVLTRRFCPMTRRAKGTQVLERIRVAAAIERDDVVDLGGQLGFARLANRVLGQLAPASRLPSFFPVDARPPLGSSPAAALAFELAAVLVAAPSRGARFGHPASRHGLLGIIPSFS